MGDYRNFFYYVPGLPGLFYKIIEDGHILKYNPKTFSWDYISGDINILQPYWVDIDMRTEFNERLLSYHEKSFLDTEKRILATPKGKKKFKDFVFGETFEYYTDGKTLACRDENFNEYYFKNGMKIIPNSIIDISWVHIDRIDVMPFILNELTFPACLPKMDLLMDSKGDFIAIDDEFRYYRISRKTGDMKEISNENGLQEDWKDIDSDYLNKNFITHEVVIFGDTLKNRRSMEDYLKMSKEKLLKDYNITLDEDLFYYDNKYGSIYAKDFADNQYKVTSSGLIPLKEKCIDAENWNRVYHVNALELAKVHEKREKALKAKRPLYTAFDLDLYENDDKLIFGYAENGDVYILYKDGIFYNINDFENSKSFNLIKNPILKIDVILIQKERILEDIFNDYLVLWTAKSKNTLDIGIDEYLKYFINEDNGDLFIVDGDKKEFSCLGDQLIPIKKGVVCGDNFKKVNFDHFLSCLLLKDTAKMLKRK